MASENVVVLVSPSKFAAFRLKENKAFVLSEDDFSVMHGKNAFVLISKDCYFRVGGGGLEGEMLLPSKDVDLYLEDLRFFVNVNELADAQYAVGNTLYSKYYSKLVGFQRVVHLFERDALLGSVEDKVRKVFEIMNGPSDILDGQTLDELYDILVDITRQRKGFYRLNTHAEEQFSFGIFNIDRWVKSFLIGFSVAAVLYFSGHFIVNRTLLESLMLIDTLATSQIDGVSITTIDVDLALGRIEVNKSLPDKFQSFLNFNGLVSVLGDSVSIFR